MKSQNYPYFTEEKKLEVRMMGDGEIVTVPGIG